MPNRAASSPTSLHALLSVVVAVGGTSLAIATPPATDGVTPPPTERVPVAESWELQLKPGPLRVHVDPADGQRYWFMTYEVVNRSGKTRTWAPRFELQSDAGKVQTSGREVPTIVVTDIQRILQNPRNADKLPPILDQNQVIGPIASGREHAREGVVIWPIEDDRITELTIYVSGLSNRRETVEHPQTGEAVELRQTRRLQFQTPGDHGMLQGQDLVVLSQDWIVR